MTFCAAFRRKDRFFLTEGPLRAVQTKPGLLPVFLREGQPQRRRTEAEHFLRIPAQVER